MKIILLGAPGAGKGTVAGKLSQKLGHTHISTGDVLRASIQQKTPLGQEAKNYVDMGKLVPDELVTSMVKTNLNNEENGYILDGYPRTVVQAKALKEFSEPDIVLNLVAPKKVILERLSGRRTCSSCKTIYHIKHSPSEKENICDHCKNKLIQRSDETPEVVIERLRVYNEMTQPVIDFYRNEGILADIDATQDIDGVYNQCVEAIKRGSTND